MYVENGAYWVPCADCGAEDHQPNQTQAQMPVVVTDSLFWKSVPDPSSPYHSEALHVVGAGIGYQFVNTRFVQEGPMNNNITGAIKFTGRDSTFTHVYLRLRRNGPGVVPAPCTSREPTSASTDVVSHAESRATSSPPFGAKATAMWCRR